MMLVPPGENPVWRRFHKVQQRPGTSVLQYLNEIETMLGKCGYPQDIGEALAKDRLVVGLRDQALRDRLGRLMDRDGGVSYEWLRYQAICLEGGDPGYEEPPPRPLPLLPPPPPRAWNDENSSPPHHYHRFEQAPEEPPQRRRPAYNDENYPPPRPYPQGPHPQGPHPQGSHRGSHPQGPHPQGPHPVRQQHQSPPRRPYIQGPQPRWQQSPPAKNRRPCQELLEPADNSGNQRFWQDQQRGRCEFQSAAENQRPNGCSNEWPGPDPGESQQFRRRQNSWPDRREGPAHAPGQNWPEDRGVPHEVSYEGRGPPSLSGEDVPHRRGKPWPGQHEQVHDEREREPRQGPLLPRPHGGSSYSRGSQQAPAEWAREVAIQRMCNRNWRDHTGTVWTKCVSCKMAAPLDLRICPGCDMPYEIPYRNGTQ